MKSIGNEDQAPQPTRSDDLSADVAQRLLVEQAFLEEEGSWDDFAYRDSQPNCKSHNHIYRAYEASNKHRMHRRAAHWGEVSGYRGRFELLRDLATYSPCLGLSIEAGLELNPFQQYDPCTVDCPNYTEAAPMSARMVTELHSRRSPLNVFIAEGTSRREALFLLSQVEEWLAAEYEQVVAGAPEEPPAVESEPAGGEGFNHLTVYSDRSGWSPPLNWWRGNPFLSVEEARELAEWLTVEAQRMEMDTVHSQDSPHTGVV